MRIAIIFYGLTRNLRATFPSIHKYIFKSLGRRGFHFDVYLHTYYLETLSNFRSQETDVPLDNDEWKMLYPRQYIVDDQNEVDKLLPHDEFCQLENPWEKTDPTRNSMRNLLRQLYSLKRCWSLLEKAEKYDGYLIMRPDLLYKNTLYLPSHPVPHSCVYVPEWGGGSHDEINDRISFTSYEGANTLMNRLDQVMEYGRVHPPHSQRFLKHIMDTKKYKSRLLPLHGKRVRATTKSEENVDEFAKNWYDTALKDFDRHYCDSQHVFWVKEGLVFNTSCH